MPDPARFDRLASVIARSPRAKFGEGVPEAAIANAERHLGMTFSPSYRWWLAHYGGGYLNGYELQGLYPEPIAAREPGTRLIGDVVDRAAANACRPGHPKHLLEILSYEGDEVFYLDTSRSDVDGEHPVVWVQAVVGDIENFAPDFAAFLERELA